MQTGYRGTAAIQLLKPKRQAALQRENYIPDPEPSDPYDPSFPMATEVHENVQILTDLNALEFARLMNALSTWIAPEQGCAYCHNPANLASDEKYTKHVTRVMIKMTRNINTNWKNHVADTGVTCWTCHRGQPVPSDIWFKTPEPKRPSAMLTGWKGGQNVAGVAINGNTSLPFDPLTPFLDEANQIAVQGTEVLPYGNRKSIKQAEWTYSLMMYMSNSLGVNCTYCHHTRAMGVWDQSSPQRVTAWHGIRMVRDLNGDYLNPLLPLYPENRLGPDGDAPKAACKTCHQGAYKPLLGASMLGDYPSLAGVLPGRLSPEAEADAVEALGIVAPIIAAYKPAPAAGDADTVAVAAAEPAPAATEETPAGETLSTERPPRLSWLFERLRPRWASQSSGSAEDASALDEADAEQPSRLSWLFFWQKTRSTVAETGTDKIASLTETTRADGLPLLSWLSSTAEPRRVPAGTSDGMQADEALRGADEVAVAAEPSSPTPAATAPGALDQIDTMTIAEIEAALNALLERVREIHEGLESPEPAGTTIPASDSDVDAPEADSAEPAEPAEPVEETESATETVDAADDGSSIAAPGPAELEELRALVQEQAEKLEAAKQSAAALSESEARIAAAEARLEEEKVALQQAHEAMLALQQDAAISASAEASKAQVAKLDDARQRIGALQARLDQERLALTQQLEVVREQRDRIGSEVASELTDQHEDTVSSMEQQLRAANARLEQERGALMQQLEVVREQRQTARASAESLIDPAKHKAALAAAEERLGAAQARLEQQRHALKQQLQLVRTQRDAAYARIQTMVARDEHEKALAALEGRVVALQARLDQNRHALEQQLVVVRTQRDQALAGVGERIAELHALHEKALTGQQRQMAALQARLDQNMHALGQQLEVVREQRDTSDERTAEQIAAVSDEHEDALGAKQRMITAMQARLDQNRHALEQQLAVVRLQRDSAADSAEDHIAALMNEHEEALEAKRAEITAMQARLDQNRAGLEEQLAVVREKRDAAEQAVAERIAALESEHESEVAALKDQIRETEDRLTEERESLERQLAIAREERDAVVAETEAKISELSKTLEAERATLAGLRDDHGKQAEELKQQLAAADSELEQMRSAMQQAQADHSQALAKAKRSVTKIRLMQDSAAELGGTVTDDGILVNLGSDELRFASGSATLPDRQLPTLDRTAALMAARPELAAKIEGHTDSSGNAAINQRLSQQRAEAVRAALIERGIDPQRLVAEGAGAARPIADNGTAQGRRQNRRVEIYVTAEAEQDTRANGRGAG